jgi:glyoxylase-like metal-dependent hydrolase (beta-lactamase superfamily II)
MNKRLIAGAVLALASCQMVFAQPADPAFQSTEVSDGLYAFQGQLFPGRQGFGGGNFALLTGSDGVILIDDAIEPMAANVIRAIEAHTKKPVDFLINTHVHGDHVGGNAALHATGATIFTHDNIRRRMIEKNAAKDALPEVTFSDDVTFHLNGHTAHVFHVPDAHTDGDAVIHFPEVNVIAAGDMLFNGLFPFIDLDSGGSVPGYIAAQEEILAIADSNTKIISGHGPPVASKSDLQASHDMLVDALARVKELVDAGKTEDEILAAKPLSSDYDDWSWFFISTEAMTRTLYRSLSEGN